MRCLIDKSAVLLIAIVFFLGATYLLPTHLNPDYIPYNEMSARNLQGYYYLLGILFELFELLGMGYSDFRIFVVILYLHLIYLMVQKIKSNHSPEVVIAYSLLVFFTLFEFFVIRLRAGISIYLILVSIYFLQTPPRKSSWLFFMFSLVLLVSGVGMHIYSGIILLVFLWPYIFQTFKLNNFLAKNYFLIFFLYVLTWVGFLSIFNNFSLSFRSVNLSSDLHIYRFLAIAIMPAYIYCIIYLNKNNFLNYARYKNQLIWVMAATLGLVIVYFLPFEINSGEAIARMFSLLSVASVFIMTQEYSVNAKIIYFIHALTGPIMIFKDIL